MTLDNQSLILLSKFALTAKRHLGVVKVMQMMNNEHYAYETLTQAALTNNKDLMDLSKKISHELHIGMDVVDAIDLFLQSIESSNKDDEYLHDIKYFLVNLTNKLYGIAINGESYRHAVDEVLLKVDFNEKEYYIGLARKFYGFWKIRNVPFNMDIVGHVDKLDKDKETFIKRWENIDNEFLTNLESWPLKMYIESMRQKGLMDPELIICEKIVKSIIIELRVVQSGCQDSYRNVIERIQGLLEREDLKKLFLNVSRDFHHFWIDAHLKVVD